MVLYTLQRIDDKGRRQSWPISSPEQARKYMQDDITRNKQKIKTLAKRLGESRGSTDMIAVGLMAGLVFAATFISMSVLPMV